MKLFEDIKCMLTVDKNIYLWNAVLLIYHLVHAIKKKKLEKVILLPVYTEHQNFPHWCI